jgi:hypothetical protein
MYYHTHNYSDKKSDFAVLTFSDSGEEAVPPKMAANPSVQANCHCMIADVEVC